MYVWKVHALIEKALKLVSAHLTSDQPRNCLDKSYTSTQPLMIGHLVINKSPKFLC